MKKILLVFIISVSFLTLTACGGRTPSAKSAHSLTRSFFKGYGKKYKNSFFGLQKLARVSVNRVEEQSLHVAEIEAFLHFDNGRMARVLITARNKPPFGWNVASWEMLEMR